MIVSFSVSNFRSYKDVNELNFASSSKIKKMPEHERNFGRLSIVKNIGIFGSNAFGKSNILNALGAMVKLITTGQCHENLAFIDTPNEPTTFDIVFLTDETEFYQYSFAIKQESIINPYVIVNEELHRLYLNGTNDLIYSKKEGLKNVDSDALKYFATGYKSTTGQLFLKYINAPERYVKNSATSILLRKIFKFFVTNIIVKLDDVPIFVMINKENIDKTTNYLKKYDIGIETAQFCDLSQNEVMTIVNDPIFDIIRKAFQHNTFLKEQYFTNGKDIYVVFIVDKQFKLQKLVFKHEGINSPLCYGYESNGTQRIFTLLALLFDKKNANKTIVIDEIERSAFSGIASRLINDFQDEFKNTNAQLVFTSHLNDLIDSVLRRDEIYFVDKNAFGESTIYPLSDFKPLTKQNVKKDFLEGSFGAIPKIGVKI